MLEAFLDEVRLVGLDSPTRLARLGLRLTEDEWKELGERVFEILNDYANRPPSRGGRPYSIFLAGYEDVTRD
jgi:hypothetical protein